MGFFVLLLNQEPSPARVAELLGHLFALDDADVADVCADVSRELYYEMRLLPRATVPKVRTRPPAFTWN